MISASSRRSATLNWRRFRVRNGVIEIGWAFAAFAAVGGVLFLVKMAYWKPEKKRRRDERHDR